MTIGRERARTDAAAAPPAGEPLRARGAGIWAGLVAIGCCIYPVVLVLLGLATVAEGVALATDLFGTWGWAFKLAGAALGVAAIVVQLRRRGQCSIAGARNNWLYIARVIVIAVAVYFILYGVTTALGEWGTPG